MTNAMPPRDRAVDFKVIDRHDEHIKQCHVCGQVFDCRELEQVFHHDGAPHKPLATIGVGT